MSKKKKTKLVGTFCANEKGFGFVAFEEEKEDVFIPAKFVNGALHGDKVELKIMQEKTNDSRAEAKIVKILKRERETIVGTFQKNKSFGA